MKLSPGAVFSNASEVIDLQLNSTCKNFPDFPSTNMAGISGLDKYFNPVVCGAASPASTVCHTFSQKTKSWKKSSSLTTPRHRAAFTTIRCQFHQHFTSSYYAHRSRKRKKYS